MYKLAVIIPAAGSGSRMGARIPKPFISLGEHSILWHTIGAFLKVPEICQVLIPTSPEWMGEVQNICHTLDNDEVQFDVMEGGSERQFSIQNALNMVNNDVDLVAVHDAVRPFIKPSLIKNCADQACLTGGAMIAVPAKDTIKKVDENRFVENTPNRNYLWQAQTPQIFKTELLKRAYASALEQGFVGTDDASLVEALGEKVKIVEGDRENLKITYPVDLRIAELILTEDGML